MISSTQPRNYKRIISINATEVPIIARLNPWQSFIETFEQVWKRSRRYDSLPIDRHESSITEGSVLRRQIKKEYKQNHFFHFRDDRGVSFDTIVQQKKGARAHSPYYRYQVMCGEKDQGRPTIDPEDYSDRFTFIGIGLVGLIPLIPLFISEGDLLSSFQEPFSLLGVILGGCTSGFPMPSFNSVSNPIFKKNETEGLRTLVVNSKERDTRETMHVELDRMIRDSTDSQNIHDLKLCGQRLIRFIDAQEENEGEKNQMKTFVKAQLRKKYGKVNEKPAIKHYEHVTGKKVLHENKMFSRSFNIMCGDVDFIIKGQIDGLTEDEKIIEVKSRTRRPQDTIPPHERAQLQTYLSLCNRNYGEIVQYFNDGKRVDRGERQNIQITSIRRDEKYFKEFIWPHLTVFVTAVDVFMNNAYLQKQYSQKPTKRGEIVNSLFIHAQTMLKSELAK